MHSLADWSRPPRSTRQGKARRQYAKKMVVLAVGFGALVHALLEFPGAWSVATGKGPPPLLGRAAPRGAGLLESRFN